MESFLMAANYTFSEILPDAGIPRLITDDFIPQVLSLLAPTNWPNMIT